MDIIRTLLILVRTTFAGIVGGLAGGAAGVLIGTVAALVVMVFRMSHAWVTIGPQIGWTPFDGRIPLFLGITGVIVGALYGAILSIDQERRHGSAT